MQFTRRTALKSGGALSILATMAAACSRETDESGEDDLARIDAVETARRIKNGEMTALESIEAAVARAKRIDPLINAVVTETYDAALAAAEAEGEGPWRGVPFFVKDLTDVAGLPTGYGSRAFNDYVAEAQFPFVDGLFAGGLISLGKSASPEFGLTATTEPLSHGATRNPWNLDHSVGGSSGGAAALVASGVVPVAHASDGGGSIRIPASCCGVVGLKATRRRFPDSRDHSTVPLLLTVDGVESRTVRDTAAFLAMMEKQESDTMPPVGLVTGPGSDRLKIAFFTESPGGFDVAPDVVEAIKAAAAACAELGHEVVEIPSPFDASGAEDFLLYWAAGAHSSVSRWEKLTGKTATYQDFEPLTFGLLAHYERGKADLNNAVARLSAFSAQYAGPWDYDVLLSPVTSAPPPEIGFLAPNIHYDEAMERLLQFASFTGLQNIAGAPAISLPLGQSAKGLPVGAQFAAKQGGERLLLELAFELEEAVPWRERTPPVFA